MPVGTAAAFGSLFDRVFMSLPQLDPLASLSDVELDQLDAACEPFVQAMYRGERPRIDDVLANAAETLRRPLAAELVREEIVYRRRQGESIAIADYAERFPDLASLAGELLAEDFAPAVGPERTFSGRASGSTAPSVTNHAGAMMEPLPLQFGRFRVERELGRGGMGVVYLAYDEKLDRRLALKAPFFDASAAAEAIPRFLREARAMANVRHANLCPVYEAGEIDGRHYLAMAYIAGETLQERLRRQPALSPRDGAQLVRKLAEAMQVAHEAGIVHRDLKPGNVLLDNRGEPVITDFGLARRATVGEIELTHTGALIGSPAYMAPEQVEGLVEEVGPAADIHALGVVLYQLLTDRRPYEGSMASVIGQIVHRQPTPPREIDATVSPALEAVCLKALSKHREDRFSSAGEMAVALAAAIDDPQAVGTDLKRSLAVRSQALWFGLCAALLLVVLGVGYWQRPGAPTAQSSAQRHTPWTFVESEQRLGSGRTAAQALGDLDADGDLDIFAAGFEEPCRVWLNDGQGRFRESRQLLGGKVRHSAVALADLDGDADLDAFVAVQNGEGTGVWLNDGRANFEKAPQEFPQEMPVDVACADLDGDGDLDVVLAHWLGAVEVLLNDSQTRFTSAARYDHPACTGVALADFDGDGAVDIASSRLGGRSAVWWNDGHAHFASTDAKGMVLDGVGVAAADLNGDADLDLYLTTTTGDTVLLNAGGRRFEPPRQVAGDVVGESVRLADLDGDGDVDAVTVPGTRFGAARLILVNDGHGHFTSGPGLRQAPSAKLAIGDVDGDRVPDLLFASRQEFGDDLWLNKLPEGSISHVTPPVGIAAQWNSEEWEWSEPENLGAKINTAGNEHSPFVSADGLTLLYHGRGGVVANGVDIWQCRRTSKDAPWGEPENLGTPINSPQWEGDPCLSADGLQLFMAAEWRGARGQNDIFLATRTSVDAPWTEPVNLGQNINTVHHDRSPALSADGLTLWFTRQIGDSAGFDLMVARRASLHAPFGEAKFVGPPINAEKFNSDCAISSDGSVLLWNTPFSPVAYAQELWWSYRDEATGGWQTPRKLPAQICKPGAAEPSISSDGRELYFSSARERDVRGDDVEHCGGTDLYVSRLVRRVKSSNR